MGTKTTAGRVDIAAVAAAALSAAESLVTGWLPDGKREGHEWRCGSLAGDRGDSFGVNLRTGQWSDFATGEKGGDLVALYAAIHRVSQLEAAKAVADELGLVPATPAPKPRTDWTPLLPVPAEASPPPVAHIKRGKPEAVWAYKDLEGRLLGYVYRFKTSDGGKEVLPLTFTRHEVTGAQEWRWVSFPRPRPLYGLDRLGKPGDVLLVEGEKCADAAASHWPGPVLTWPGGSNAVQWADLRPLAGRQVVCWPDADCKTGKGGEVLPLAEQPGQAAMERIARALVDLKCTVDLVRIPPPGEKPDGWDVADAIAEGLAGEALVGWVQARRRPFAGPQPRSDARVRVDIDVTEGDARTAAMEVAGALAPLGVYFSRGAVLVRATTLADDAAGAGVTRPAGSISLLPATPGALAFDVAQVATLHRRRRGKDPSLVDLPATLARVVIEAAPSIDAFPALTGVAAAPVVRPDGTLHLHGHDVATGVLVAGREDFRSLGLPSRLRIEDARRAREKLQALFSDFPFSDSASLAVVLSAILTAVQRPVLPTAPLHAIDANAFGAGKSLLADIVSTIATGRGAMAVSQGHSEEEFAKRVDSIVLAGDQIAVIDNVTRPLGDATLCAHLTAATAKIRQFGTLIQFPAPHRTFWMATGQNLIITKDMARRTVLARVVVDMERPELRPAEQFKIPDIRRHVRTHRHELLRAALAIVAAYAQAGRPAQASALGSFEDWSRDVRSALIWAGAADPVRTQEAILGSDPDREAAAVIFSNLCLRFGEDTFTVSELTRVAIEGTRDSATPAERALGEQFSAMGRSGRPEAQKVQGWLRRFKDRVVGGCRLALVRRDDAHGSLWRIHKC